MTHHVTSLRIHQYSGRNVLGVRNSLKEMQHSGKAQFDEWQLWPIVVWIISLKLRGSDKSERESCGAG